MSTYPKDSLHIEIRTIYDGTSIVKTPDGTYHNVWEPGTAKHAATEAVIQKLKEEDNEQDAT